MRTFIELVRDSFFSAIVYLAPRFANVLLFILIGRQTGPAQAGLFSLATTYLIIFTTITRGLDDLVIRQVSREPDQSPRYLTNFLLLRLGLSLLSYCVLLLVVLVIFHYDNNTAVPILILTLSLVPDNLALVAQAILLGQRRFGPPAITMTFTSLFKLIGGELVLASGGSLYQIAWVWLIGSMLGMVLLLIVAARGVGWLQRADWLDWRPLTRNWRAALPFVFITTMMTLEGQADVILLSTFRNETEVGWYSAATTIAFSLAMLSQAYRMSVYPLMARYALQSPAKLSRLYEWSLHYLGVLILPMVTGVALLSPRIVLLVFGSEFQPTAKVLQVLILALVFMFLNVPNARIMLVKDRQGWNSLFLLGSVMSNLLLNLALDRPWGALGAAVARLFSSAIYFVLSYLYVVHFLTRVNLIKLLSKPMLATVMMAVAVLSVRTLPLPIPIAVGVVAYAGTLWLVRGVLPDGASAGLWRKAV